MSDIRLSGFTFIKNGISLGFPFVESIESIASWCDEVVINVGFEDPECTRDDGTWEFLQNKFNDPKFVFIKSWWDPAISSEGRILSQQTNIALEKCRGKYCQYIQGDEAIHEDDVPLILECLNEMDLNESIDGLVYNYLHFYGDPFIFKHTRNTYRREVRLIRNHKGIQSWKDAQGFKTRELEKLNCIRTKARIFHYGWARSENIMDKKVKSFGKLYHGSEHKESDFSYQRIWGLRPFKGSHPQVMNNWVNKNRNELDIMSLPLKFEWKNVGLALSDAVEATTGYRIGEYKNYRLL